MIKAPLSCVNRQMQHILRNPGQRPKDACKSINEDRMVQVVTSAPHRFGIRLKQPFIKFIAAKFNTSSTST